MRDTCRTRRVAGRGGWGGGCGGARRGMCMWGAGDVLVEQGALRLQAGVTGGGC